MTTPGLYPIMLNLRGRRAVVIGGGTVAEQKVRELVDAGARVRVIAPSASAGIRALATTGTLELHRRRYEHGDLRGAWLAIAATNDREVNRLVWEEAEAKGVLLNAVDDVEHCHFIAPSVHRQGDITVTVSTAGACPTLAVRLRERIAQLVRPEHAEFARLARSYRDEIARRIPDFASRRALWYRIVDSDAIDQVRRGDNVAARRIVDELVAAAERGDEEVLAPATRSGIVYLVGAGPGDAGLITARGLALLRAAQVVLYDGLVGRELLDYIPVGATALCVGKHGHGAFMPQEEIDRLMIVHAQSGKRVVRLKGGDPFVFGRGAEEAETLRRAGVRFEIVPGVSSAIAAAAAANIPVTHRDLASGFAVVTGHECRAGAGEGSDIDWSAVAKMPTVVVLMGLRALSEVTERLIAHGMKWDTPAAVVSNATRAEQRCVTGTLANIVEHAGSARIEQPATLIVGEVVRMRARLAAAPSIPSTTAVLPVARAAEELRRAV